MKRVTILFTLLLTGATFFLSSCVKEIVKGNGVITTESRAIAGFTRVQLEGSGTVTIVKGATFKVTVTDDQNILPYVKTTLSGGELSIGYKDDAWVRRGNLKVAIEMPAVEETKVDGSGSMTISGGFSNAGRLKAGVSGSGDIFIQDGNADTYNVVINGSGNVKSFGLISRRAVVQISGSGDAELSVTDDLDVSITGSGDVYYTGNPVINTRISGSGRVIKR
jgi:Putative auto-transporter adhesin, head GIN domain